MRKQIAAVGTLLAGVALAMISGCAGSNQTALKTEADISSVPAPQPPTDAESVRIGSIHWYVNYEDAMAEAKRSGRPVWLHFGENPG